MHTATNTVPSIRTDNLSSNRRLKLLIADDDLTNRLVLQSILSRHGYESIHAENGQQAIEVFEREHPDLILMDVVMPGIDGYQATEIIKQRCGDEFVPIIFLTAMTDEYALAKCVQSGGDDFLTKPYNHVILGARIEALLRIRELYNTVNTQKKEIAVHKNRMDREAKMAEGIFANIVRSGSLSKDYIKHILSPMSLFNGDVLLAAEKPSGGLNLMVGDFTGHGMAAATGALPASAVFYQMSNKGFSIAEIIAELNRKMHEILPAGMFMAACIVNMDPISRSLSVWNGGLPGALLYRPVLGEIAHRIESQHLPLGILSPDEFDNRVEIVDIEDGDLIYLYSDGVTEATNKANEMFGQQRLDTIFSKNTAPYCLFEDIKHALEAFTANTEQSDDITLVEITYDEINVADTDYLTQSHEDVKNPAAHWQISLDVQADLLRHTDPLPVVVQSITEIQGLTAHRPPIYTILSELFTNALDHGILGLCSSLKETPDGFSQYYLLRQERLAALESGYIKIEATHSALNNGGHLLLRIEDSGNGFDYQKESKSLNENSGHSGRGVPLLHTLCESVTYQGKGNIVEAVYVW